MPYQQMGGWSMRLRLLEEGVIDREIMDAGNPEDMPHVMSNKAFNERSPAGSLGCHGSSAVRKIRASLREGRPPINEFLRAISE